MAKEKKKVKDPFLKGRKRSLESKKPEPCQFCQIQVQGFSERLKHESKCKKRPNRGNFTAAAGAEAAGAAARGVAAGGAAANDPNQFCGDIWHEWYAWQAVRPLLCRAPKLQKLVFERSFLHGSNLDNLSLAWRNHSMFLNHLTTCLYKGFMGVENKMELVRQILRAARVLKTMKITCHSDLDPRNKPSVRKKLRKFRRSTRNCQIAFDEGHFT